MRVEVASWAVRPNEPSGFRGRKAILNHCCFGIGLSLPLICHLTSEDIKQHYLRQRPFSPSVPAEAGCLFAVAASVHVFISGESLQFPGWLVCK